MVNWENVFYTLSVPTERRPRFRALIKKRFQCDTWTTQDGRCIPIRYMTDSHLVNSWNMIYRNAVEKQNEPVFDSIYIVSTILNNELKRRKILAHEDEFDHLESIFMAYDPSDWSDGPMDHYQAMRYFTGKD